MLDTLTSVLGIIITIILIVGIHEFGHFFVAKWCGIKVLRFSIGFGKPLLRCHDKSGTEYVLAAIPLGGYVKMLDETEGNVNPADIHRAYNRQPYYKKLAVVVAGPLANFIFAFCIYWALFIIGFVTPLPIIGQVTPNSIAADAGLSAQQEILQIDGHPTHTWSNAVIHIALRAADQDMMQMQVKDLTSQAIKTYTLNLSRWKMNDLKPDPLESLGIIPYEPVIPTVIGKILPDSPAANSELRVKDKIIAINKIPMKSWVDLMVYTTAHPEETVIFMVERDHQTLTFPVTIGYQRDMLFQKTGTLGIASQFSWPSDLLHHNQYSALPAFSHAWGNTVLFTQLNFHMLGKMLTGKISLRGLGGPITIYESAGSALHQGLIAFFSFLAFLSISIGVINILPVPGLDGGHVLFQTIEAITRRPLMPQVQLLVLRLGIIFLLVIMFQALVNDIMRLS